MTDPRASYRLAEQVLVQLTRYGATLATAESLTGGLVGGRLTAVAGASSAYRGGVIAYAGDLKATMLGVDAGLLEREGAVSPEVARQMASGVRDRLGSSHGLATTGVAGPAAQHGQPVGRVHLAVASSEGEMLRELDLVGSRDRIREDAVRAALHLLLDALTGNWEAGS